MAHDWDIKARSESCHECEIPFEDKQGYYSALVHGEEGYARGDYCEKCWPIKKDEAMPYSTWQGVYLMPPPPEEEALKKETAESLLRKMMEDDDESKRNVIFILAVMLERKKLLIEKDVKKDGEKITRFYEHRKTGETFVVPDPRLRLDELEEVQKEVVVMLGGKVPEQHRDGERAEGGDLNPEGKDVNHPPSQQGSGGTGGDTEKEEGARESRDHEERG